VKNHITARAGTSQHWAQRALGKENATEDNAMEERGCGGLRGCGRGGRTKVFGVFVEVEAVEETFLALGFS